MALGRVEAELPGAQPGGSIAGRGAWAEWALSLPQQTWALCAGLFVPRLAQAVSALLPRPSLGQAPLRARLQEFPEPGSLPPPECRESTWEPGGPHLPVHRPPDSALLVAFYFVLVGGVPPNCSTLPLRAIFSNCLRYSTLHCTPCPPWALVSVQSMVKVRWAKPDTQYGRCVKCVST